MQNKPKIMITFRENGENGGPFVSHERIMNSTLNEKYDFIPLIIPKGSIGVLNFKLLLNLVRKINETDPDIIHFTGLQLEGFHTVLASKLASKKVPSILAVHGSSLEAIDFPKWKKVIVNILEIITIKLADASYGVSEYVSNFNRIKKYSRNHKGTIYNLSNNNTIDIKDTNIIRKEIGISEDEILVVSTGRITKEKGYEVLLETILNSTIPKNVKFLIVGDGDYLKEMKSITDKNNLENEIFYMGYRDDVEQILSESDIFVSCTLHETLGNSIIEAGAHSLPIVASNVGGIPEIVQNGVNGYLTEVYDINQVTSALQKLIISPELRRKMGSNSKKIIQDKFSKSKIIMQLDKLYKEILLND